MLAQALLGWFDKFGRKNLPWQQQITPYRVWVSEIMLQQTQVETVVPYYQRFMERFPTLSELAAASVDDVLSCWSGLGYYARGRNLHKAAQIVDQDFAGELPLGVEALEQLPGIGRSTAGAITSISQGMRAPILDGNVKRVLARMHCIDGWPGAQKVQKEMWVLAEKYTPSGRFADYTQAIMDLGATVCTRSRPKCSECPWSDNCQAYRSDEVNRYPVSKPKKVLPVRSTQMLILQNQCNDILLLKRPPLGLWGGLWSLPETEAGLEAISDIEARFGVQFIDEEILPSLRHTFSHFHLDIVPVVIKVSSERQGVMDSLEQLWYNTHQLNSIGLPAPVKKILQKASMIYP